MPVALVTGVTGQDGHHLTRLLISKGYQVVGVVNGQSNHRAESFSGLFPEVNLVRGDLTDFSSLIQVISKVKPDEIYNLGAVSHVGLSFNQPELTANVTGLGALRLLEAVRKAGLEEKVKFYQASSSEMFGKVLEIPQNENTPLNPQSPYAISKVFSHYITQNYRNSYGIFACSGILFNHESPLRGEEFVTRKITVGLAKIITGKISCLYLGNINAKRDWGYSGDYVEAMWLMMQRKTADDFVIATNKSYSVKDFINEAVKYYDLKIDWKGEGIKQKAVDKKNNKVIIRIDPKLYRPSEVNFLKGNAAKARNMLKWKPKVDFKKLVEIMSKADINRFLNNRLH
jgi:GDPmannose 4,6-dehydratase